MAVRFTHQRQRGLGTDRLDTKPGWQEDSKINVEFVAIAKAVELDAVCMCYSACSMHFSTDCCLLVGARAVPLDSTSCRALQSPIVRKMPISPAFPQLSIWSDDLALNFHRRLAARPKRLPASRRRFPPADPG